MDSIFRMLALSKPGLGLNVLNSNLDPHMTCRTQTNRLTIALAWVASSILHKLPNRQRRDGLKYKAKRVLKSAMRRLDLSFAKAKQQALNTAIGR